MSPLNAEDRCAIAETLSLHGHLFDGGHLDRLGEIFAPGVVYDLTDLGMGTFEGIGQSGAGLYSSATATPSRIT